MFIYIKMQPNDLRLCGTYFSFFEKNEKLSQYRNFASQYPSLFIDREIASNFPINKNWNYKFIVVPYILYYYNNLLVIICMLQERNCTVNSRMFLRGAEMYVTWEGWTANG